MKLSFLFYEPISDLGELSRRMAVLKELGYQGVELTASHPAPYPASELLGLAREHGLAIVSFLSGWSYGAEKLCLAGPDAEIRARAVERLISYSEYAARLGAHVVVGLMQGFHSDEPDEAIAADRIADCLRQAARRSESFGGRLVLEP